MQTKPESTQALIPLQDSAQRNTTTSLPQLYGEGSEQYEGKWRGRVVLVLGNGSVHTVFRC